MFSDKRDCFRYTSHDKNDLEIKVIYVHHYIADEWQHWNLVQNFETLNSFYEIMISVNEFY